MYSVLTTFEADTANAPSKTRLGERILLQDQFHPSIENMSSSPVTTGPLKGLNGVPHLPAPLALLAFFEIPGGEARFGGG